MRLRPRRWHDETWICSLSGHVAPAAVAARVTEADAALGVDLPDGSRLSRCLRCDVWLRGAPPTAAAFETVPPLDELDLPLRGRPLHDQIVVRLIALERLLHILLFGALAVAAALVELRLDVFRGWADDLLAALRDHSARGESHRFLTDQLEELADVRRGTLWVVAVVSAAYATVEAVEAVGLWRGRRWAEYLTVAVTAAFLPFELRELAEGVSPFKVAALAVNLAVVAWLVWNKRLFGVRGGAAALVETVDWDAVLATPDTRDLVSRLSHTVPVDRDSSN